MYELPVTEIMFRLIAADDLVIDVGANVGYFTSLMACRVGPQGRVLAFEPHPQIRQRLHQNVALLRNAGAVTVDPRAISESAGTAHLVIPPDFTSNMGLARLGDSSLDGIAVQTVSLDEVIDARRVALLKLDIEGHEMGALEGARDSLAAGLIQNIVFEEHARLPTPVSMLLEEAGFSLFALRERLRGVELAGPADESARPRWHAPTFLATRSATDAAARIQPDGWRSLRSRFPRRGSVP